MKIRWIALLAPAALALALAGTADAGGYGGKHGYYGGGHGFSHGGISHRKGHHGPRHHGFRGHGRHGFRGHGRHGFRGHGHHDFGRRHHRGFDHRRHGFGHRRGFHGSGVHYGLLHGHIRAPHYIPLHSYGSVTLRFGY